MARGTHPISFIAESSKQIDAEQSTSSPKITPNSNYEMTPASHLPPIISNSPVKILKNFESASSAAASAPNPPTATSEDELLGVGEDDAIIREQDRLLPIANVARIMKQAVPSNAKIAKDAKETVVQSIIHLSSSSLNHTFAF